jgi:steroid 5-alpha reductase family enzyme
MLVAAGWMLAAATMAAAWAVQRRTKNVAIVDTAWTAIVAGLAVIYAVRGEGWVFRRMAIASMMGSWGASLTIHLLYGQAIATPEEDQPAGLHRATGGRTDRWFFWFFQLQALAALVFSLPALFPSLNRAEEFSTIELTAAALWALAFAGETTADRQLLHFRMNPENRERTCVNGLWRYSRHPNYVFEWLVWLACALFASGSPYGWAAFACPAIRLAVLLKLTAIPATGPQPLSVFMPVRPPG